MSWGKAMWRLYKLFTGLSTVIIVAIIIFWVMTLTGCSSQKQVKVNNYICIDHYHENFYLENYDYWLCLTSNAVCQIDTFYIAE